MDEMDIELQKAHILKSMRKAHSLKEWKLMHYCRGYLACLNWIKGKISKVGKVG